MYLYYKNVFWPLNLLVLVPPLIHKAKIKDEFEIWKLKSFYTWEKLIFFFFLKFIYFVSIWQKVEEHVSIYGLKLKIMNQNIISSCDFKHGMWKIGIKELSEGETNVFLKQAKQKVRQTN